MWVASCQWWPSGAVGRLAAGALGLPAPLPLLIGALAGAALGAHRDLRAGHAP